MDSYQLLDNEVFEKIHTTDSCFNWHSVAEFKGKNAEKNAKAFYKMIIKATDDSFKIQPAKNSVRNRQAM